MGTVDFPKDPGIPCGIIIADDPGSSEFQQIRAELLAEAVGKLTQHLESKLPQELSARLDPKGNLKDLLHSCLDQNFLSLFRRYIETADVNHAALRHTPNEIAEILSTFGGADMFNTGEIEKKFTVKPGFIDLNLHANNKLRQKNDIGVFLSGIDTCSVVKCSFRDNIFKPKTVTDVKLCVNIPDSDLVSPGFRYLATAKYLIKDLIAGQYIDSIDREIYAMEDPSLFETAAFIEKIAERCTKNLSANFENTCEKINKNLHIDAARSIEFNSAVEALVLLLNSSNLAFQFIERSIDNCHVIIREYEDIDTASMPDEHYEIKLALLDHANMNEERKAYDRQISDFENKVRHLENLIEVIYQDSKSVFKVNDFEDLSRKNKSRIKLLLKEQALKEQALKEQDAKKTAGSLHEDSDSGDISFRARLARMHERMSNMYEFLYPIERRVMEERLYRLEGEYMYIDCLIDPHQLQPGLVVDLNLSSIKRKKTTINAMAAVLKEFLISFRLAKSYGRRSYNIVN